MSTQKFPFNSKDCCCCYYFSTIIIIIIIIITSWLSGGSEASGIDAGGGAMKGEPFVLQNPDLYEMLQVNIHS